MSGELINLKFHFEDALDALSDAASILEQLISESDGQWRAALDAREYVGKAQATTVLAYDAVREDIRGEEERDAEWADMAAAASY